jgi:hypothetical protein
MRAEDDESAAGEREAVLVPGGRPGALRKPSCFGDGLRVAARYVVGEGSDRGRAEGRETAAELVSLCHVRRLIRRDLRGPAALPGLVFSGRGSTR